MQPLMISKQYLLRLVRTVLWLCLATSLSHCVTVSEIMGIQDEEAPVKMTYYQLRSGSIQRNPVPYPSYIPVYIQFHYSDNSMVEKLAFRQWDFNGDGSPEMVEVMSEEGKVYTTMMDFNGDGAVDMTRQWDALPEKW